MSQAAFLMATPLRRTDNGLGESMHRFGSGIVGVLHRPTGVPADTAVLLLNAGLVDRAGPFRGYVRLARSLADAGFAVLRFDQSGVGDSPVSRLPSTERRARELAAAMTLVGAETGAKRFVLAGICSGADDAFHLAASDARVVGAVLIDGLAHRTPGYWWRFYLRHRLDPRRWLHKVRHRMHAGAGEPAGDVEDFRDFPARDVAAAQLAGMVARDVRLLLIYTGGSYTYFNHEGQLAASLGPAARAPQVRITYWPDCDHTFYLERDRQRLFSTFTGWMQAQFGSGTTS